MLEYQKNLRQEKFQVWIEDAERIDSTVIYKIPIFRRKIDVDWENH
jgi:hypothetical protein